MNDDTGGVLPGVTVEAVSPALIEGSRLAVTDAQGRYAFTALRPGVYTVTFTLNNSPGSDPSVGEEVTEGGNAGGEGRTARLPPAPRPRRRRRTARPAGRLDAVTAGAPLHGKDAEKPWTDVADWADGGPLRQDGTRRARRRTSGSLKGGVARP